MFPALESTRRTHEDIERLLRLGSDALALSSGAFSVDSGVIPDDHPARRSALAAEHLAAGLAEATKERLQELKKLYGFEGRDALEGYGGKDKVAAEKQKIEKHREGGILTGVKDEKETAQDASVESADVPTDKNCSGGAKVNDKASVEAHGSGDQQDGASGRDPAELLSEFYEQLRDVKALHRREGDGAGGGIEADAALVASIPMPPDFSGEEGGGRYLDLQTHYSSYVNLLLVGGSMREKSRKNKAGRPGGRGEKRVRPGSETPAEGAAVKPPEIDYLAYLKKVVVDHASIAASLRSSRPYELYLDDLLKYLVSFADRLHPLSEVEKLIEVAEKSLRVDLLGRLAALKVRFADDASMLEEMGADGVRDKLLMVGLKCGGRPEDRASRLLEAAESATSSEEKSVIGRRVILEGLVTFVLEEMLSEELRRTVLNVEKKQSLSWVELEAERVAEEAVAERDEVEEGDGEEDENEEKPLYNPKDVPLGWDGKPIPFWLYKLHGLNHEYRCEICGNAKYKGPRAFERHFTDPQHVQGLRCLDVSYSRDFFMVTRIADAVKLRTNLQRKSKLAKFDADVEEEYEDNYGNVCIAVLSTAPGHTLVDSEPATDEVICFSCFPFHQFFICSLAI